MVEPFSLAQRSDCVAAGSLDVIGEVDWLLLIEEIIHVDLKLCPQAARERSLATQMSGDRVILPGIQVRER